MLNDNTLISFQIMAIASVGERDQISHMYGRRTMRLCYARKTSAQALYAKDSFLARTHLWVSLLPTAKYIVKDFPYIQTRFVFSGIYSQNCPEWVMTEQAAYCYSMVIVPLYDTLGANACAFIVNQSMCISVS